MNKKIIGILFCAIIINAVFPTVSSTDTEDIDNISSKININNACDCDLYNNIKNDNFLNSNPDFLVMKNPPDMINKNSISLNPDIIYTPDEFSWKDYDGRDWTTIAKNQGYCGSCWAFAALGSLESIINIREDCAELDPDLSEQYVLSCLPESGGCWGGSTSHAFYLIKNTSADGNYCNGVISESCFPYRGIDAKGRDYDGYNYDPVLCSEKCEIWEDTLVPISNYGHLDLGGNHQENIQIIKSQIFQNGPVAAGILATNKFYDYWRKSNDPDDYYPYVYSSGRTNHIVVIVGWKDDPLIGKGGYWICKNSWGSPWGYDGFFNIEYGSLSIDRYIIWVDYNPNDFNWAPKVETGGPYGGFIDQEIIFNGSKSFGVEGAVVEYYWDFGDGTNDTEFISTHVYSEEGIYIVSLTATDSEGNVATENTTVSIQEINECPSAPFITGEIDIKPYSVAKYNFSSTDNDGNYLYYYIDWGDCQVEEWIGPFNSGEDTQIRHKWFKRGNFTIKAKSKDVFNEEGDWGTLEITVPLDKGLKISSLNILKSHTYLFSILKKYIQNIEL